MNTRKRAESGQIMAIMAVAVVALLGFAALAIDTGMTYSDRRYDQSVADAAALAGAQTAALAMENYHVNFDNFSCGNLNDPNDHLHLSIAAATTSAINRAGANSFTIDNNISDGKGVQISCTAAGQDKRLDIKVMITSQTKTSFIHLFYGGPVVNTVTAVTRIRPRSNAAWGNAILSLRKTCNDELLVNGSPNITVKNGGVFANGCIALKGTSGTLNVQNGTIGYVMGYSTMGSPTVSPAPAQTGTSMGTPKIPKPSCSGLTNRTSNGTGTHQPGIYNGIKVNANDKVTLSPGLYCLTDDIDATGGEIVGENVTIMMVSGKFDTGGNTKINIKAPSSNDYKPAIKGLLIYIDENNPCNNDAQKLGCVDMQGTGDSSYTGTVFSPKGPVDMGGNAGLNPTYNTQVIGDTVTFHGNGTINMNYVPEENVAIPTNLELTQ